MFVHGTCNVYNKYIVCNIYFVYNLYILYNAYDVCNAYTKHIFATGPGPPAEGPGAPASPWATAAAAVGPGGRRRGARGGEMSPTINLANKQRKQKLKKTIKT